MPKVFVDSVEYIEKTKAEKQIELITGAVDFIEKFDDMSGGGEELYKMLLGILDSEKTLDYAILYLFSVLVDQGKLGARRLKGRPEWVSDYSGYENVVRIHDDGHAWMNSSVDDCTEFFLKDA